MPTEIAKGPVDLWVCSPVTLDTSVPGTDARGAVVIGLQPLTGCELGGLLRDIPEDCHVRTRVSVLWDDLQQTGSVFLGLPDSTRCQKDREGHGNATEGSTRYREASRGTAQQPPLCICFTCPEGNQKWCVCPHCTPDKILAQVMHSIIQASVF